MNIKPIEAFMKNVQSVRPALIVAAVLMLSGRSGLAATPTKSPLDLEVGRQFIPTDVNWSNAVYQTTFDDPAELENWKLEGGKRMSVENGKLVLETTGEDDPLVCWLKAEAPADFLLEFTVRPQNRKQGLNIVFFNARGIHGESIFDPLLKPRDGTFKQYTQGDLNNYHISYWAAARGTAHVRKNPGFGQVANGKDLIAGAPADAFQVVRIYKRGGKIRLMVDDIIAVAYDDDGKKRGPVWTNSGWIGLRQMAHTIRCEYDHLKIFPLKPVATAAKGVASLPAAANSQLPQPSKVVRFKENPIIRPEMFSGLASNNICFPSLIRVPPWLPNPLGKYYLYFADHHGDYIRLAYAERVEGPWKIYEPGTLKMEQVVDTARAASPGKAAAVKGGHIASPDVHVDDDRREIRMYFHYKMTPAKAWGHRSGVAISQDGIHFQPVGSKPLGEPYFRVFRRDGYYYAVDRVGDLTRSRDGLADFEAGNPNFAAAVGHKVRGTGLGTISKRNAIKRQKGETENLPGEIRHTGLKLDGDVLTVFFSRGGDLPEHIMCAQSVLTGDWKTWRLSPPVTVLKPTMDYEGGNMPLEPAKNSELHELPRPLARDLRDPFIFREDGQTYLLYSVAGERGIAGATLRD